MNGAVVTGTRKDMVAGFHYSLLTDFPGAHSAHVISDNRVASLNCGGAMDLFDFETFQPIDHFPIAKPWNIDTVSNGKTIAMIGGEGRVFLYENGVEKISFALDQTKIGCGIRCWCLNGDASLLAVYLVCKDEIEVYDCLSGNKKLSLVMTRKRKYPGELIPKCMVFEESERGIILFAASTDHIYGWDMKTGEEVFHRREPLINPTSIGHSEKNLIIGNKDSSVRIMNGAPRLKKVYPQYNDFCSKVPLIAVGEADYYAAAACGQCIRKSQEIRVFEKDSNGLLFTVDFGELVQNFLFDSLVIKKKEIQVSGTSFVGQIGETCCTTVGKSYAFMARVIFK